MGYAGSQDIFTCRFGRAVDNFVDARATEDCLIVEDSMERLLYRVEKFFKACREAGITLNNKKCGHSVVFAGYRIDENGAQLDPELYHAISEFPIPQTLTNLRSFLGLAQQQSKFVDTIAELSKPFHELLKKNNDWIWMPQHSEAFKKMREELSKPSTQAYYDHRKPTRLYTDASRLHGLSFVLKQKQSDGNWRIVQAGSRYLSGAEERYAMVELELLAIAWACQKTASFIEGINFMIVTDHKPLIPILRDYSLAEIENKRLQRLRMKVNHLSYDVIWVKGQDNVEADALSRAPASRPQPEDEVDEPQANAIVLSIFMEPKSPSVNHVFGAPHYDEAIDAAIDEDTPDPMIKKLLEEADKDEIYLKLLEWIKSGFPDREGVEVKFDPYLREQDCL